MLKLGYALSSEEHDPAALIQYAVEAEAAGFDFALISDHFHPWLDVQGQSSFVWSVLGAIAVRTDKLEVGTGVTCPTFRLHPAIVAQAAATIAAMMPGRFFLGLGSGENLNEHIVGTGWPPVDVRHDMLVEAIEVIRKLWSGDLIDHRGEYFTVDNARIYTLPERPPPIYVAAGGPISARLAAEHADGIITTSADGDSMRTFRGAGHSGPRYGQLTVCWAPTNDEALETAFHYWPTSALRGSFKSELPLPKHFEELLGTVRKEDVAQAIVCSADAARHLAAIQKYADAGYDHVYIHNIGHRQSEFFEFYRNEVLPDATGLKVAPVAGESPTAEVEAERVLQASWESFPASDAPAWRR